MSSTVRVPTRTGRDRRRSARWGAGLCAFLTAVAIAASAMADARSDYLVNVLRTSPIFRVRTQAAISLGSVETSPSVIAALSQALRDDHPSVRAAAASSLERQGDPSALPALQRAQRDPEAGVRSAVTRAISRLQTLQRSQPRTRPVPSETRPSGNARFYVAVGRPGTKVRSIAPATLDSARDFIAETARSVPGVEVAPANERPASARGVIQQRNLSGYYLDSSIVEVQQQGGNIRVRVSVVVQTYPERNIRSMLNGTASASGSGPALERQVIEGAFRGALRGLPQVLAAGAAQARRP